MINISIAKHHVCFPAKLLAGNGGKHIYNIVLGADTDNGTIVSRGDYVSFDQYKNATAPTGYKAVVREQNQDGTWLVEVVDPADAILICQVEDNPYANYDSRFTALGNFYNAKGDVVLGYELAKGDMYSLSENAFTGKVVAGKSLTVSGQNHVVGA